MRIRPKVRGLRLSAKLVLVGVPLTLFVPWMSYLLLAEMERLSVQQQSNQQMSVARTIAIAFAGRDDLFATSQRTSATQTPGSAPWWPGR